VSWLGKALAKQTLGLESLPFAGFPGRPAWFIITPSSGGMFLLSMSLLSLSTL
jgi:hypothetical protein